MAEVFLARRAGASPGDKAVVVKRMLRHLCDHPEFRKMFANEARLAVRLRHHHIARTLDLGEHHGELFIAMEFINGEDLAHVARAADKHKLAPLPHGVIVRVVVDACKALHHAHHVNDVHGRPLGIVHRDVSPQNILITYDGLVKIIDFGVAKATALVGETQAGVMKGKYAYMSPEQCRGEGLDKRADVFAAAVVAWEMFAWKRLFKRDANYLTLAAVVGDPVPEIHPMRREVPPELDAMLLRALSKSRDERHESCLAFAEELEALADAHGWDTSPHTLAALMHQLFLTKIEAQRRVVAEAHADTLDQFLLTVDEGTKLRWLRSTRADERSQGTPSGVSASDALNDLARRYAGSIGAAPPPPPISERPTVIEPTPAPPESAVLRMNAIADAPVARAILLGILALAAIGAATAAIPPDAAPAPPPADRGAVIVRGQKEVMVFVEGKKRGETPLVLDDLAPGRPYVLLLVADGYHDGKVTLAPLKPRERRTIKVKLKRAP